MIKTKYYLDTRKTPAGRAAPLKIAITVNRARAYIPTGISLDPDEWDPGRGKTSRTATQQAADIFKANVDMIVLDLSRKGALDGLPAPAVRDRILDELNPKRTAPARFLDVMRKFASTRQKQRTREIYEATVAKVEAFDPKARYLTFADIDIGWLDRFDAFLARTSPKRNARNIHFRNIRAVFNHAHKYNLTLLYPFRNWTIRPEETAHRNLTVEQLRRLFSAELPAWKKRYVDFFELSFLLIGMNTEDLLHAERISGGRLEYRRAKTYRPYSIKVEPECQEILDRYPGEKYLLNVLDTYSRTNHWTSKVNNVLKDVAKELGLPRISMYWARHSWGTIAINDLDIPRETVSAALGHSGGTVTDIYINFDRAKIDRANRQMIDYVLHDKRGANILELLNRNMEQLRQQISGGI